MVSPGIKVAVGSTPHDPTAVRGTALLLLDAATRPQSHTAARVEKGWWWRQVHHGPEVQGCVCLLEGATTRPSG